MISHKYRCIFIHIPKTAGTSIEKKLNLFDKFERGVQDHRTIKDIEPVPFFDLSKLIIHHGNDPVLAKILLKKMMSSKISKKLYDEYFKFTFVRNPWGRVFSWYKNVMRDEVHRKRLDIGNDCTMKEFLIKHKNSWALRSQLFWLRDWKGNIPLDFIGRFEELEKDFAFVSDTIGILDKDLPKLLVTNNSDYTKFYDSETIDIVYNIYKEEINMFKFEYGQ